jgi:hypothetical protein
MLTDDPWMRAEGVARIVPIEFDRPYHQLPVVALYHGDRLVFELPKKLESPNRTIWAHWSRLRRERQQWEQLLTIAWRAVRPADWYIGSPWVLDPTRVLTPKRPVAVAIVRAVGSGREYIRDDDNLAFSPKPLYDALKRVGLIYDDRRTWLRTAPVTQQVSRDGRPRTFVVLGPADEEAARGTETE